MRVSLFPLARTANGPVRPLVRFVTLLLCCLLMTACAAGDLLSQAEQSQPQTATLNVDFHAGSFSTHATGGLSHSPLVIYLSYPVVFGNQRTVVSVVATANGLFLGLGTSHRQIFPLPQTVASVAGGNGLSMLSDSTSPTNPSGGTLDLFGYQLLQDADITGEETLGEINTYHVQGKMPSSIDLSGDIGTVNEDLWINQDNYYPVRFAFQSERGPSMTVNFSRWDSPPAGLPGGEGERNQQNNYQLLSPLPPAAAPAQPTKQCKYPVKIGIPLVYDLDHTCVGDVIDLANGSSATLGLLANACDPCALPALTVAAILVVYASWLDWADRHGNGGAIVSVYPFFNAKTFIPFIWVDPR